jgi:branched-chain amino acid transport system substrate-binding protein
MFILALAVSVGACSGAAAEVGNTEVDPASRHADSSYVIPADAPIVVGVSVALTGPIAPRGTEIRDAVVVGIERWKAENGDTVKGHEIEVRAEDDGCFVNNASELAAERLIETTGLIGVIGPHCSSGTEAAMPIYSEAGVVMISPSATKTNLTLLQPEPEFFFRTVYTNAAEGTLQASYVASQLNAATAYVIDDSESYGEDLADAAQETLEESGIVVTREHIVAGAVDFSVLVAQIMTDNPDVVIFEGYNPEGALLCRQLRDAGYVGHFMAGDAVASVPNFVDPLGEQAEGAVFTGCMPDLPEDFLADYVDIVGHEPTTPFAAHVVDAVYILLDAVVQVAQEQDDGSLEIEPLEFRDAVRNPKLLVGLSGTIAFDEYGDRVGNAQTIGLEIGEVRDGEIVLLEFP